jgi:hypothetical protein
MRGVYDCARSMSYLPIAHDIMWPSPQQNGIGTSNLLNFAAQYPAYGLPCERFTFTLTSNRASLGVETVG